MQVDKNETLVSIQTDSGNIVVKLYNETPLHRDNFIKLVKDGTYNGVIFHRVIKDFMIQGGDPTSKNAQKDAVYGEGDLGYTLPAEFRMPQLFHKKGALAAARTGDEVNPDKESSASQFYIVLGRTFSDEELSMLEKKRFEQLKQSILSKLQAENKDAVKELYRSGDKEQLRLFREQMIKIADEEANKRKAEALFSTEQREAYKTVGGTPHLDGSYTVFGEVIDGQDIAEKIQSVSVNRYDRPLSDIKMKMVIIE